MNKVILIGNLTRDPKTHTTQSGDVPGRHRWRVNPRKRADGTQEADFIPVTVWGKLADAVAQYRLQRG